MLDLYNSKNGETNMQQLSDMHLSTKKVFKSLLFVFLLIQFTSCDNFLKGSDIKNQLDKTIDYANATECTIIVKSDPIYGAFLSDGEKKCRVGYSIDLQYTVTTIDYNFLGFEAVSSVDNQTSRDSFVEFTINNPEEAAETRTYKITVKLLKAANDIIIQPKFEKFENADYKLDWPYNADLKLKGTFGEFNPVKGVYNLICGRSYNISFDPEPDYEFIYWQVYDEVTGNVIPDGTYIQFTDVSKASAEFKFLGVPKNTKIKLAVRPIVVERPQILSYSPIYLAEGVFKDSTIQVVFDYDMDEYSIYYTDNELKELRDTVGEENILPPITLVKNQTTVQRYYGYKQTEMVIDENGDEQEEEVYYYKNISIKDNEYYQNRNKWFKAPYFDNPRTLSIPTENGEQIPDYFQFLVTIEKDFFYKKDNFTEEGKNVTMAASRKWIYLVKDVCDNVPPSVATDNDIRVSIKTDTTYSAITKTASIPTPAANTVFNVSKKLKFEVKLTDTGSGPSSNFDLIIDKVQDASYSNITPINVVEKNISYQRVTSQNAIYNKELDFSSLDSGVYKVSFKFKDRSGKPLDYPPSDSNQFYFMIDEANTMKNAGADDTSTKDTDYRLKVKWTEAKDLAKTSIRYKKSSDTSWSSPVIVNRGTTTKEFNGLTTDTQYDFELTYTDFANNIATETINKTTGKLDSISVSGTPSKTTYYKFNNDDFSKTGLTVTAKLTNGKTWNLSASQWTTDYSNIVGSNSTVTVKYTSGGITKQAAIGTKYNIARADAITKSIKSNGSNTYKFGDFPQTLKNNNVTVTSNPIYTGYGSTTNNWYLGSDGYFYVKCKENPCRISSNDPIWYISVKIQVKNNDQYFKVEPIIWKKLTDNYNGKYLLIATKALYSGIKFSNKGSKTNGVYPNNYKYSTIRSYLNGTSESGDNYEGKGFLQTAFSTTDQNKIQTVTLNNDSSYDYTMGGWSSETYYFNYTCPDTQDKVFLLSRNEMTNTNYGFSNGHGDDNSRKRNPTDYALANGAYRDVDKDLSIYMLRTPWYETKKTEEIRQANIWSVNQSGALTSFFTSQKDMGIVPAICLSSLQ